MFITEVLSKGKQGQTYKSILLRESSRQGAKVKSRTLAVLTKLPADLIALIRRAVEQSPADGLQSLADQSNGSLQLRTAESFGAVWVVAQIAGRLGIGKALGVTREAELALWQVLARVLRPGVSLLAMVRLATHCAAAAILRWRESLLPKIISMPTAPGSKAGTLSLRNGFGKRPLARANSCISTT